MIGVTDLVLPVLGALGCLLLLAGFLIRQGLHGWPKNAVLLCRRCEYMLHGLDEPKVCPECGADLTRRRAIRVGENRRRKRVLIAGSLVLLLTLALSWLSYTTLRQTRINWNQVKPVWMLRREARHANAALVVGAPAGPGSAALMEIVRRLRRGEISDSQLQAAAADALAIQGDPNAVWESRWGEIIDRALQRRLLNEAQSQQYYRQAFLGSPQVRVAARVPAQSPLRIWCTLWPYRGSGGNLTDGLRFVGATLDATLRDNAGQSIAVLPQSVVAPNAGGTRLDADLNLTVGQHAAQIETQIALRWFEVGPGQQHVLQDSPPLATWTHTQGVNFEVIAAGEPAVKLKADDQLRGAVAASLEVDFQGSKGYSLAISNAPANLCFDVLARLAGDAASETRIGSIVATAGFTTQTHITRHPVVIFPEASTVEVVFRANPQLAESRLTITEVWDGEIVLPNIPLKPVKGSFRFPATTRPGSSPSVGSPR